MPPKGTLDPGRQNRQIESDRRGWVVTMQYAVALGP
jgi:hypothetical protein